MVNTVTMFSKQINCLFKPNLNFMCIQLNRIDVPTACNDSTIPRRELDQPHRHEDLLIPQILGDCCRPEIPDEVFAGSNQ